MTSTHSPPVLLRASDVSVLRPAHRDPTLTRVRRGVYTETERWDALTPWERYRVRVEAVAMTWDSPVFALESAAAVVGLPLFGEPRDIHLIDPGGKSRRYGDVVVHGADDLRAQTTTAGLTATSLRDTAIDLGRVLPPAFGLAVANAALRMLQDGESIDFAAIGRAQATRRGQRRLEWIQSRASAVPESPGESVSLAVIEWLGFELPECQVTFSHEGFEDRPDFFWRDARVLGESDGYGKYDDSDPQRMKEHFVVEKIREDRLRRNVGPVCRWDWSDAMRAKPLDAKLVAAGLVPVRPRSEALLATLRANPRSLPRPASGKTRLRPEART